MTEQRNYKEHLSLLPCLLSTWLQTLQGLWWELFLYHAELNSWQDLDPEDKRIPQDMHIAADITNYMYM